MEVGGSLIVSTQVVEMLAPMASDLKGSMRGFFNELSTLLRDYGDPAKDMIIDGVVITAEEKYGPYGTLVFNNKINTLEQVQTTLLNVYDSIFKLEKSLTGTS